jgi:dihydroorotase-like cyclic amidohydrolase
MPRALNMGKLLAFSLALFSLPAYAEVKALKNFTLIDGSGGPAIGGAAMLIDDGRISWIGSAQRINPPAGAEVIDLSDKFIMPGIINLHGHVGSTVDLAQDAQFFTRENVEKTLRIYASYGVTTVLSRHRSGPDLPDPQPTARRSAHVCSRLQRRPGLHAPGRRWRNAGCHA